jgi:hypothetical protein
VSKKLLILILIVIAVIASAFFLLLSSDQKLTDDEKTKALSKILGREPVTEEKEAKGEVKHQGKYATFSYPAKAKIYTFRPKGFENDKNTLEYFSFDIQKPRIVFNFSVAKTFIDNIEDFPGVKLREMQSSMYEKEVVFAGGYKGILFEKTGRDSEETIFFLLNKNIYTISITGSDFKEIDLIGRRVLETLKFI